MRNLDYKHATDIIINNKSVKRIFINDELAWEKTSGPYLNISPVFLWILPDLESSNYVYSNTDWNVD